MTTANTQWKEKLDAWRATAREFATKMKGVVVAESGGKVICWLDAYDEKLSELVRQDALEEAATLCDTEQRGDSDTDHAQAEAYSECAQAIRKLKGTDMTERKILMKEICTIDPDGRLLESVVSELTELAATHGAGLKISKESYAYSDDTHLAVMKPTPETDWELDTRIRREKRRAAQRESLDRAEYVRLAKVYGGAK
jgi:hypothetical protein